MKKYYLIIGIAVFVAATALLLWSRQDILLNAANIARVRAIQEAYNDRQIDREQARRMLGDLGEVVDDWPPPPDPDSLPEISLDDLRKHQ